MPILNPPDDLPFTLRLPLPKALTPTEELGIARAAYAQRPDSQQLRDRLAVLLLRSDLFDDVCALYKAAPPTEATMCLLYAQALLSREAAKDDDTALRLLQTALTITGDSRIRGEILALMGKATARSGREDSALELLQSALKASPTNADAYKRTIAILLRRQQPERVQAMADNYLAQGIRHPRLLASRTLATAMQGDIARAHQVEGLASFGWQGSPSPPDKWQTAEDFNAALTEELLRHPDITYERYGTASAHTWRINEPSLRRSRVLPALQQMVLREVTAYVQRLRGMDHPFVQAMPNPAMLRMWCVMTEEDGHETWHVHQNGWLSGTYYVAVPSHIVEGVGHAGCIAFGLPEDVVGANAAAAFGTTLVRPRPGLMTMFPSHVFHRTYQHGGAGRRICCAFDVVPQHDE